MKGLSSLINIFWEISISTSRIYLFYIRSWMPNYQNTNKVHKIQQITQRPLGGKQQVKVFYFTNYSNKSIALL